ncbi:UNVERIFIED_CONTAM: hypothetical protein FKN15_038375 [Acipenser sinensis]
MSGMYTHCCNHVFNLVISSGAAALPVIRNTIGTMQETCMFLSKSAQQSDILCKTIEKVTPAAAHSRLKPMCETRWVERHDSVVVFVELFAAVSDALDSKKSMPYREAALKAQTCLSSVNNVQFIVGMTVIESILSVVLLLSRVLQKANLDNFAANQLIEEVLQLQKKTYVQKHCSNYSTEELDHFYRQSIFVSYLDFVISELTNCFADLRERCGKLWCLLPNTSLPLLKNE